ncbi:histone H2A-Bbd type 2/3 [Phodopus roborovskii]|uniref:Histone H2A n=1 Tax=Phodopus roborovskii TaxID=109678 RepID=A0AAU9Z0R7_PHORO|nr:histone H2A-Bbd type 2/3 [Phodopus roborovskii]CAH6781259.1 H2afb3 [Phodopus roborovskii]
MPRTRQSSRRGPSSRRSRTDRAELTFSVSLVERLLRESGHARRLSQTVPILLTAILEFLTRRLLELASNEAQRRGAQRLITPELLDLTIYNNRLLSELFQSTTISQVAPEVRSSS